MWREKQDFLLAVLREALMRARLELLLEESAGAMREVDFCLGLLDLEQKMVHAPKRIGVFNLKTLGSKQDALVVADGEILGQVGHILEKYARLEYRRQRLLIDFRTRENWEMKRLLVELLAVRTEAECESGRKQFCLRFRAAEQMSLW